MIVPFTHQHVVLRVADQYRPLEGIAIDLRSMGVQIRHTLRLVGLGFSGGELIRLVALTPPTLGQNLELEISHVLH
ncbi:hypothetical protein Acife_0410 [Acidithiobacillus ferrivorans SS3]|uniref:Uncharacterized protein n=1 Tax=Acidithiobacillus ferrivorans SS3 TaxID=743299 RepID=G0JSS4_9PROT|nr:hypothetical protein [Acidithiobacillus ferrivorans]AEM46631.1 hypothetical protein Acife_0410 [Acidithiobacillus ferrivorans SS3]